jgi:hypothetical protein
LREPVPVIRRRLAIMRAATGNKTTRISRRAVLGGAAAGAAAVATGAIGRVPMAQAANGDPLLLGQSNDATGVTSLTMTQNDPMVFAPVALDVISTRLSATAIHGQAVHTGGIGVRGEGNHGVVGTSYDTTGAGVVGEDATGSSFGRGVIGGSTNGWGVSAISANGQALRVTGRATFDRSGQVTIAYPNKSATVLVPGDLSTSSSFPDRPSLALAMLQTNLYGVYVTAAVLGQTGGGNLTIYLNKAPGYRWAPKSVVVGWFIVN